MFVCLCVRVPTYLCVEIMNHLGASRHRETKRKLSDRETTVQQARRGSVFCSICVQNSIGSTNNINCLKEKKKKKKKHSMHCYHISLLSSTIDVYSQ